MITVDAIKSVDVSTRAKRKKAACLALALLEHIHAAEEAVLGNVPPNLQGGAVYANAECSAETILDAIMGLMDAY